MSSSPRPPTSPRLPPSSGLISVARVTTLLVSVLVALCSGTNYVCIRMTSPRRKELTVTFRPPGLFRYDTPGTRPNCTSDGVPPSAAYGPQLGVRLGLSHTQQNLVGLGGNGTYIPLLTITTHPIPTLRSISSGYSHPPAGTYGSGPFHGKLVDARGPRPSLIIAFFTLSVGYLGTRMIFKAGLEQGQEQASTATVALLILCGFLTGNGGSGGLASSLNAVAKSFPEHVVSNKNISKQLRTHVDSLIVTRRELALQGWCYPASDCQLSCSLRSHIRPSLGIPLTSSLSWQLAPRCR